MRLFTQDNLMKLAFFISSAGDTDLALNTIKRIETKGEHEIILIPLTKTAQGRIVNFNSILKMTKIPLPELLHTENQYPDISCSEDQIGLITEYLKKEKVDQVYCGVPSISSNIPFQIAGSLEDLPVLIAYEFMYQPENHDLWHHLPILKNKSNIKWALPLKTAVHDFGIEDENKLHIIGHLSIDNAISSISAINSSEDECEKVQEKIEKTQKSLLIAEGNSFAFVSSTTQPIAIDCTFLNCVLEQLPKHPNIEVRLGLHPGIENLDSYLIEILKIYKKHQNQCQNQFKIILTDSLFSKLKNPELTVNSLEFTQVFIRTNVNGDDAAAAADRIAQAVPGASPNKGVMEGKTAYTHFGITYLPKKYFANNLETFFSGTREQARSKKELGLDDKTAPEHCAELLLKS